MSDNLPPLPDHWIPLGLIGTNASFQRTAREYAEDYARAAIEASRAAVPAGIDIDDLKDRLVAISSAVADDDDRAAQAILRTTLVLLSAAPQQVAQPSERTPPERDHTKLAEQQGVFRKFDVSRVDGSSEPGGKHHGCEYFVLDVDHDPIARAALTAYADAVEATHPVLAADMRGRYGLTVTQAKPEQAAQPFFSCVCFDEVARRYCKNKGMCSSIVAAASPNPKD